VVDATRVSDGTAKDKAGEMSWVVNVGILDVQSPPAKRGVTMQRGPHAHHAMMSRTGHIGVHPCTSEQKCSMK
jgi:hypothetical protein